MRFKDITLHNIRNFIEGNLKSLQRTFLPHEKEQVIYRATACSDCLNAGKCKVCGCATPGLFYAPQKRDSEGKWGPFMPLGEWEKFKKTKEYAKIMGKSDTAPSNLRAVFTTPPRPGITVVSSDSGVAIGPTDTSDYDAGAPNPSKGNLEKPAEGSLPAGSN